MASFISTSSSSSDSGIESGMSTVAQNSRDLTPERGNLPIMEDEDDFEDESLVERLWGLTEMFPEKFRYGLYTTSISLKTGISAFYSFSRSSAWVISSSAAVLLLPLLFEQQRFEMLEMQRNQQKQILLGTGSTNLGPGMAMMPSR